MLRNAYTDSPPVIAVSDELFVSNKSVSGINWFAVDAMRKKLQPYGFFKYVYVTDKPDRCIYKTLLEFSIRFTSVQTVIIGNVSSERHFLELGNFCEFVYAPLLCSQVRMSSKTAIDWQPNDFIEMLRYFTDTGIPFSKEQAFEYHLKQNG